MCLYYNFYFAQYFLKDKIFQKTYETGFANLSYFNRLFKKKYGISPRVYRKSL